MRKLFAIAALLAVVLYPSAAQAGIWKIHVKNETTHCAWITVYTAHGFGPWSISGAPGFVAPGAEQTFSANSYLELKVRAEVKAGAACTNSGNVADTYDVRTNLGRDSDASFHLHLVRNHSGRFNLWFLK